MGKRSVKENKNIYQLSREAKELSREAASELLEYISPERIEKIESGKSMPHPDEVLTMEEKKAWIAQNTKVEEVSNLDELEPDLTETVEENKGQSAFDL